MKRIAAVLLATAMLVGSLSTTAMAKVDYDPYYDINPIRIESIEGMAEAQALDLLDALLAHATRAEHEYRHRWRVGDLTLWDNRCLLHRADANYDMSQHRRVLHRTVVRGTVPY